MKRTVKNVVFSMLIVLVFLAVIFLQQTVLIFAQDSTTQANVIKVACVGDSITAGGQGAPESTGGYTDRLRDLLGMSYQVKNFGVSGATLMKSGTDGQGNSKSYRAQKSYADSKQYLPQIVVIMLGTNDAKPFNWDAHKGEFLQDYIDLINDYKKLDSKPQVFVAKSAKAYGNGGFGISPGILEKEILPLIEEAAKKTDTELIDVFSATGNMQEDFKDNIHPTSDKSKLAIATAVFDAVSKYAAANPDLQTNGRNTTDITGIKPATTEDFSSGELKAGDKYQHPMPYRYFVPRDYDGGKKYPMLLYLHGAGRRGNDNANQLNNPKAFIDNILSEKYIAKYPAIIVVPQCPAGEQWVDTPWTAGSYRQETVPISDELQMVVDIVDQFKKEYSIDASRIYIAGQSMGGYGTWDLITRYPEMFAAAIPMCGAADLSKAPLLSNLPIWAFHGDADTTVPLSGSRDMVEALRKVSKHVRYTEYAGIGHEVQVEAFKEEELIPWLFSQSKDNGEDEDQYISVRINNRAIKFLDQRPVLDGDRILVPMRSIFEALGAAIDWQEDSRTVTAKKNTTTVTLQIGSTAAIKNGDTMTLDVPAKVINDRTMVPVRFIGEAFGAKVQWDELAQTVGISTEELVIPINAEKTADYKQSEGSLKIAAALASDEQAENPADNSRDGDPKTRWAALGEKWIAYDLGDIKKLTSAAIMFFDGGNRVYQFDIEVSQDGKTWTKVLSTKSSGKQTGFEKFAFDSAITARYVRYNGKGNSLNTWNSLFEFEIYGE